jgi:tripartite-type tricarboxylate transporter receptor subunit TctC
MKIRNRIIAAGAAALFGLLSFASVPLYAYPAKPIKLIVPYTPGGAADQLARVLGNRLGKDLGQAVIVENKPGANTAIGAQHVAQAAPDGYTIFLASSASMVLNPLLYSKLAYNPERDLAPVSLLTTLPLVMVVNPSMPVKTVGEFVNLAKSQPGKINFASVGTGNPLHLAGELFKMEAGVDMTHVPYNGSAPALTAVMSGEVHTFFDVVSTSVPLIRSGKLRGLAVTTSERLKALPDLPTIAEAGYPRYEASTWFGIAVPKKTPPDVVATLNAAINRILEDKSFRDQFEGLGLVVHMPNKPNEALGFIHRDREKWGAVVKEKQITLD